MKRIWITILLTGFLGLYCASASVASYTDGTGIVTDNITGLVWQKCIAGQTSTDCSGTAITYSWEDAIRYCTNLSLGSFTDWRLPNLKELSSLVDDSKFNPSIDPLFTGTQLSSYWSSTTYAGLTVAAVAWIVPFNNGDPSYNNKTNTNYVRCVRGQ